MLRRDFKTFTNNVFEVCCKAVKYAEQLKQAREPQIINGRTLEPKTTSEIDELAQKFLIQIQLDFAECLNDLEQSEKIFFALNEKDFNKFECDNINLLSDNEIQDCIETYSIDNMTMYRVMIREAEERKLNYRKVQTQAERMATGKKFINIFLLPRIEDLLFNRSMPFNIADFKEYEKKIMESIK